MSVLQPHCSLNCSGLGSSAFARHYLRNHYCFLFLRLLRCFSSPGLPLDIIEITGLQPAGLSHSEICGLIVFANPRSLSQLITSFIASESQGIPHTPLSTFFCIMRISYFFTRILSLGILLNSLTSRQRTFRSTRSLNRSLNSFPVYIFWDVHAVHQNS